MRQNFGVFEAVFGEGAPYLKLLHLSDANAREVVHQVIALARSSTKPYDEVRILLSESNWRPHLVGAIALGGLEYDSETFSKLWRAIDTGSWVTPQLAAMAFLRDSNFISQTKIRLENLCPLDPSLLLSMTPVERHSAAGPAGGRHRSAKTAAALKRLLQLIPQTPDWLVSVTETEEFQKLIKDDFDNSAEIAEEWLAEIKTLLPH